VNECFEKRDGQKLQLWLGFNTAYCAELALRRGSQWVGSAGLERGILWCFRPLNLQSHQARRYLCPLVHPVVTFMYGGFFG